LRRAQRQREAIMRGDKDSLQQTLRFVAADAVDITGFHTDDNVRVRSLDGRDLGIFQGVIVDVKLETLEYVVIGSPGPRNSHVVHADEARLNYHDGTITIEATADLVNCLPTLNDFQRGTTALAES
jgi:hypothetical protein